MRRKILYTLLFILPLLVIPEGLRGQYRQVSENNRYLVTREGEPFFWLGDTGWEMLHRLDREEMEHYLRNRAGKGFTVIQTVIVSEIDGLTFPNKEDQLPFIDFDPDRPNESYFEMVDYDIMAYLPYYRSFAVNTSVIGGDSLRIWWYDPRTMHAFPQGFFENSGIYEFSNWSDLIKENQSGPDWVVVIDDATAGYEAPGR